MITTKYYLPLMFSLACSITVHKLCAQMLHGQPLIDSLLKELSKAKDDTSKIKNFCNLAVALAPNDNAASLNYANQCMNISRKIKWEKGIGLAYYAFAEAYYEISDYTTSLQNGQKAYDIFKSIDHKNNMGSSCLMIAKDYRELGYYTKAIVNDLAALRIFETINDKRGVKTCYSNLGNSYYYNSDYDKAIENYNKAITASRELNDQYGIASELDNMSSVFIEKGMYDSANVYNLQAVKVFEEVNNQPELSRAYFNRGNVLMKLYDAKSAYQYYIRATEIDKRLGIKTELLNDYGGIGEIYLDLAEDTTGKYIISPLLDADKKSLLKKARYYFKQVLSPENTGDIHLLMFYSNLASQTEEKLGSYETALALHKEYMLYKDSIYNDENKKKIAALETQRLAEVKDKEIQLLNRQKALEASEVKRQTLIKNIILGSVGVAAMLSFLFVWLFNKRRKTIFDRHVMEVEMKALRSQMNPHFIFNSLHSINKYVIENDKENASAYLSKFSNLMRLILENSREQEVPIENDLCAVELYMQLESLRFKNRFTYIIETDPGIDKENTLIPPMLLQPFVENAIIHGMQNKESGLIKISVEKESDMIKCTVEDNGIGRKDIVTMKEDGDGKRKSLGITIINERLNIINQLKKAKAAVKIFDLKDTENKPGGLRIELLLPLQLAF